MMVVNVTFTEPGMMNNFEQIVRSLGCGQINSSRFRGVRLRVKSDYDGKPYLCGIGCYPRCIVITPTRDQEMTDHLLARLLPIIGIDTTRVSCEATNTVCTGYLGGMVHIDKLRTVNTKIDLRILEYLRRNRITSEWPVKLILPNKRLTQAAKLVLEPFECFRPPGTPATHRVVVNVFAPGKAVFLGIRNIRECGLYFLVVRMILRTSLFHPTRNADGVLEYADDQVDEELLEFMRTRKSEPAP
jgi:hypothetical protein